MDYTLKRLDKTNIACAAHLLRRDERLALKYDSALNGLLAFYEGICVGAALFLQLERSISLQSLVVSPGFRRNGIGSALLRAVCAWGMKNSLTVYSAFSSPGVSDPVYRLMSGCGMSVRRENGFVAEISREDLQKSFEASKTLAEGEAPGFFTQSSAARRDFSQRISTSWPYVASLLRYGLNSFDASSSCVVQGNQIKAASLISWSAGMPELSFLYADPGCGRMAMAALGFSVLRLLRQGGFERLCVTVTNSSSVGILNRLCDSYEIKERLYTAYYTGL